MKLPIKCVVDTNVALTANKVGQDPELDACAATCVAAIMHVMETNAAVIDEGLEILGEYGHKLNHSGQPGVGDAFFKWLHDRVGYFLSPDSCNSAAITPDGDSYAEFPDHPGLRDFDRSDRKFVAVANAHPDKPPILQATDSKWWGWKEALQECGIKVQFLCEAYIREKYRKKMS